jgi:ADP-heptose:LPS heptosyltransferase
LQDFVKSFPWCEIDIIVKGKLEGEVFKGYKNDSNIIILPRKPFKELLKYLNVFFSVKTKKYDLAINGAKGSSSGKILTYLSNSDYKIYGEIVSHKEKDYQHMGKNNIYNLKYYFQQLGYLMDTKILPPLDIKLTKSELLKGEEVLSSCVSDSAKKTILIFTFATGAKCHSKEWWNEFYEKLVASFGAALNILEVLPMENVSQIDFKASS